MNYVSKINVICREEFHLKYLARKLKISSEASEGVRCKLSC